MNAIVVGAGIVGASAALHLVDSGVDVLVVDDQVCGRATRAGAGWIAAPDDRDDVLFELARRAFEDYPTLASRIDAESGGATLDVIGHLYAGPPGAELDAVEARLVGLWESGYTNCGEPQALGPIETKVAFPYLQEGWCAVAVPTTARLDGEATRLSMLHCAELAGAELLTGHVALFGDSNQVGGVVVDGRIVLSDAVLVTAGAWSADLLRPLGFGLAVEPQRGQIVHLGLPGVDTSRLPAIQPIGAEHYLLPFADGRVVIGATWETGSGFDPRLTASGVAAVLNDALRVAPGLSNASVVDIRVGLRPHTPDERPHIGPASGIEGLWIATGMGSSGLNLGPYSGRLIAELMRGHSVPVDLRPFIPDRPLPSSEVRHK